ncbi:MAG: hypothetical protein WCE75_13550 [Terracidiphilus sp.]
MGNRTPLADLMVVSPEQKQMFLIDVKGLYRKNFWLLKPKEDRDGLFYVLAYVPNNEPNQFFVMTQAAVNSQIRSSCMDDDPMKGIKWTLALQYEGEWQVLPK